MSEAKGFIVIPAWVDSGQVKPLADNSGYFTVNIAEWLTSIQAQVYGYINSAWQKQPMQWGFTDTYLGTVTGTADGSSPFYVSLPAIASGYVAKVTHIVLVHNDTAARIVDILFYDGSGNYVIKNFASMAPSVYQEYQMEFYLKPGQYLRSRILSETSGRTLTLTAFGYKMKVND